MTVSNDSQHLERLSRYVVITATLWMLAVGLWEIAAPFGAGHAAVLPARGIMADNMVKHGILFPLRQYTSDTPSTALAYAHHPFGTYYLFTAVRLIFGRHEWAIRLVPVVVSTAMPGLLYLVGRRLFGAVGGAVSALGWAVLPITLAFAQFPSFEMFSLAAMLLVIWAALRFEEYMSRWRLIALLAAVAIALQTDWTAYLFVTILIGVATVTVAFGATSDSLSFNYRRFLQGLVLVTSVVTVTLFVYVLSFRQAGLLNDWFGSAEVRAKGNDLPLRAVLLHRRYWIEVMFTKPGVVFGILGAVAMFVRLVVSRRLADSYPLLLLLTAAVHYVHFKGGADVHIYWPLPFSAQFCFALGVLASSVVALGRWLARRLGSALSDHAMSYVALGMSSVIALLLLPDGIRALDYSRNSGCRLNDDGQLNLQDLDKNSALEFFKQKIPEGQLVTLQSSMFPNWSQDWALERPTSPQAGIGLSMRATPRHDLLDVRFAIPTAMTWAAQSKTTVVGPFWLVDPEARAGELRVYGFEETQPSWLQRLFVQSHDPIRRIVEDPYRTWEYRHHLLLKPNPEPEGLERKDQRRVLHNVLVAKGDVDGARRVREELESNLETRSARGFKGGLKLLGHRFVPGIVPRLEIYFLAAGSVGPDAFFDVRSRVLRAPRFSFVVKDDKVKRYGVGFEIHPSLWKAGMIYVSSVELRGRPGVERFFALWTGSQRPRPSEGIEEIPLLDQ